jgi:hypothetical protein
MKRDLRRIEATLNQLSQKSSAAATINVSQRSQASAGSRESRSALITSTRPVSFEVQAKASPAPIEADPTASSDVPSKKSEANSSFVTAVQATSSDSSTQSKEGLNLPKFKMPSFTSHRNGTNPALASSLLKEILTIAESWQTELKQVLSDIQDLYIEGPIVDGWLESRSRASDVDMAMLHHAEPDRLANYVEEIYTTSNESVPLHTQHSGYVLCGLNSDGQVWSTPCPPEQLPSVSLAIARHQKLRQLLSRKQYLENRLNQLSETLVVMHSQLKEERY